MQSSAEELRETQTSPSGHQTETVPHYDRDVRRVRTLVPTILDILTGG